MTDLSQFQRSYLRASTFAERAFAAVDNLHSRKEQGRSKADKALVEEVLTIAVFLRSFDRPGRRARCKYFGGNHPFDAEVLLDGRAAPSLQRGFLEVTSSVPPTEYLEREALDRHGFVFQGRHVRRVGSRARGTADVESRPDVWRKGDDVLELQSQVLNAIRSKLKKEYPSPCALLVRTETSTILQPAEWYDLALAIAKVLSSTAPFESIYLVQTSRGLVLEL